MMRRLGRGDATRGPARMALAAVTLLMGVLAAFAPTGSPTTARAAEGRAAQPQETFESTSPAPIESASPSESPVESVTPSARTITIESADLDPVDFRDLGEVRGVIDSDNPGCEGGQVVRIAQRPAEDSDFRSFGTATSRANGKYEFVFDAMENADYIASVDQTASCAAAESGPVEILVRVLVFFGVSDRRVFSGQRVRFTARIRPCGDHAGTMIELLRIRKDDEDDTLGSRNLDKDCRAVFTRRVRGRTIFRALWREQDNDHAAGSSDRIAVKVIV